MIGVLEAIAGALAVIGTTILNAIIAFANLLIAGLAAFAAVILALLPGFPDPPSAPSGGILGTVNWIVPIGPLVAVFLIFVGCWLAFMAVKIALKWVKAL